MSVEDIKAEIAVEVQQRALLANDLAEAVLAGESTGAYRGSLAATDKAIADLATKLDEAEHAEEERRCGIVEATAREISAESHRRHEAMIEALMPPSNPAAIKEFSQ